MRSSPTARHVRQELVKAWQCRACGCFASAGSCIASKKARSEVMLLLHVCLCHRSGWATTICQTSRMLTLPLLEFALLSFRASLLQSGQHYCYMPHAEANKSTDRHVQLIPCKFAVKFGQHIQTHFAATSFQFEGCTLVQAAFQRHLETQNGNARPLQPWDWP